MLSVMSVTVQYSDPADPVCSISIVEMSAGIPVLAEYGPGTMYTVIVGASPSRGLLLSASGGDLSGASPVANTCPLSRCVSSRIAMQNFSWTAPSAGNVTLSVTCAAYQATAHLSSITLQQGWTPCFFFYIDQSHYMSYAFNGRCFKLHHTFHWKVNHNAKHNTDHNVHCISFQHISWCITAVIKWQQEHAG